MTGPEKISVKDVTTSTSSGEIEFARELNETMGSHTYATLIIKKLLISMNRKSVDWYLSANPTKYVFLAYLI